MPASLVTFLNRLSEITRLDNTHKYGAAYRMFMLAHKSPLVKPQQAILALLIILCSSLAGCTSAFDGAVNPRADLVAFPTSIQQGESVNFDASLSDAIEGVITEYQWDFGDGTQATSITAFATHVYSMHGSFTIEVTVFNDGGGEDSASTTVFVNGAPIVNLSIPQVIKAGDSVELDASNSVDPEGEPLTFAWDLDWTNDSDGDTNRKNDIDATGSRVLLPTSKSGTIRGSLVVSDNDGASISEDFTFDVLTRKFKVTWQTRTLDDDWSGNLEQGDTWQEIVDMRTFGRVLSYEATLDLGTDILPPQDNFTLTLTIPVNGYEDDAKTQPGNITRNETAQAKLEKEDLNPEGIEGEYESDSEEELLVSLLNQAGARFGYGNWTWSVTADQADPDSMITGIQDPDPGNDWTLTIRVEYQVPVLTEIAYE